jgi:hypothetical protein
MRKTLLLAAVLMLGLTPQAMAHEYTLSLARPYAIVTTCDDDNLNCESRMDYTPGEHSGLAGVGSYWYQLPSESYLGEGYAGNRHVEWCTNRYRTYDPGSDTFVGNGYKRYRCNSPYDRS